MQMKCQNCGKDFASDPHQACIVCQSFHPKPGQYTICFGCGDIYVFTTKGFKVLTKANMQTLRHEDLGLYRKLTQARSFIVKLLRSKSLNYVM